MSKYERMVSIPLAEWDRLRDIEQEMRKERKIVTPDFRWIANCDCGWFSSIAPAQEAERQVNEHLQLKCLAGFDD